VFFVRNFVKLLGFFTIMVIVCFSFTTCDKPNSLPPVLTGSVGIIGTVEVGQTLTTNVSALGGSGVITFQWANNTVLGSGNTYSIQPSDVGSTIIVTITRSDNSGSITSSPTAKIIMPKNSITSDFIIDNLSQVVGNVTHVMITPKLGKSFGEIIIYYDGSTLLPVEIGSYTVTFDVGYVTGFQTITGLYGGILIISDKINAQLPIINFQSTDATIIYNASHNLIITASSPDNGILTYQWFSNTSASNTGGTAIPGATSSTYNPLTGTVGSRYYYVVVTNTISNNGDGGNKIAVRSSNAVTLTVSAQVVAQQPNITGQPIGGTVAFNGSHSLTVTASSPDSGILTYQWYSNTSASNTSGTIISGATFATYNPPTGTVGSRYYYVVVTNTISNNGDEGTKTATRSSNAITLTVSIQVTAQQPNITHQPTGGTVIFGGSHTLSITANSHDSGNLTYQWYSNTSASNVGGIIISGATSASYHPPTTTAGTFYYFIQVTNTISDNGDGGTKTATARSTAVILTVNARINAQEPNITGQPTDGTVIFNGSHSIIVMASSPDNGTLTYQWYSNTNATNIGGSLISGATSATYNIPTGTAGTRYYYVIVTNTISNNGDGGTKTATRISNAVILTVSAQIITQQLSITVQPTGGTVAFNGDYSLTVTASSPDSGTLTYQWYSNTSASNTGGIIISGATSATYNPSTNAAGTKYYYVVVTNTITNNGDGGIKTNTRSSNAVTLTVNPQPVITINTQPINRNVNAGNINGNISIAASWTSPDFTDSKLSR